MFGGMARLIEVVIDNDRLEMDDVGHFSNPPNSLSHPRVSPPIRRNRQPENVSRVHETNGEHGMVSDASPHRRLTVRRDVGVP